MNIIPLASFPPSPVVRGGGAGPGPVGDGALPNMGGTRVEVPFRDMLTNAFAHMNETAAVSRQDSINLALGEIDDIGAMNVNSARAGVAFDLFLQVRNRVLEAYQEMMRMNV